MKSIVKISYVITCILYLVRYIQNINLPFNSIFTLNLFIIMIYFIFDKKNIIYNKKISNMFIFMIILFGIYPLIFNDGSLIQEIFSNTIRMLIFMFNIYFTAMFIYINKEKAFFIKSTYIILTIFLISIYIMNFDNFEGILNIKNVFSYELRYRNAFGLYHPNATGSLCMATIILSIYLLKLNRLKRIILIIFSDIIILLILISTSSRNSITCLAVFFVVAIFLLFYNKFFTKFNKIYLNKSFKIGFYVILIICLIIALNIIDINELIYNSNRMSNFIVNIPAVFENEKELFGLGYIQPGFFNTSRYIFNTTFVDNWYLYTFVSLGIIGFIFSMILLIYLIISIIFDKKHALAEKVIVTSILATNLYHSIFETAFLYPQFFFSYISWIIYFLFIYDKS